MEFLFNTKKKDKLFAIFDIGSGSVGGAFVKIPSDNKKLPIIINSIRKDITNREISSYDLFLSDMVSTLKATSHSLYQSKLGAPDKIVCVLASPWYISENKKIKISKNNPITFTKKIIDDLIKKELKFFINKNEDDKNDIEIIENSIIGISKDGILVSGHSEDKARSLEIDMITSFSPKICLNKIREVISKDFHDTPVSFSSFMLSSYIAVRDRYMNHNSYMLMDIGGEVTDVNIISESLLKDSFSYSYGKKTLFKEISQKMNIELRDAYEIFNLFNNGNLSEEKSKKLIPILNSFAFFWKKNFKDCLSSLSKDLVLPKIIFLTIDFDIKDWFVKIIKEDYGDMMILNNNFTVVTLDGREFLNMCSVQNSSCDPFIMIEAISLMRRIQN